MKLGALVERWWKRVRGQPQDEHDQRLMRLYWNRAELKKELADIQDQRQKLLATVESHQVAIRRASEQIDELAAYLGRPEVGPQALLYFQLRALWLLCARKLTQFVTDLCAEQEERERRKYRAEREAVRSAQLAEIEERILNARSIADSLDARLTLLQRKLDGLRFVWNYWRRRDVRAQITQVQVQLDVARTNVTDFSDERAAVAAAPFDEFQGLSLDGKRVVNIAALAYAEWLILSLPARNLAALSRHAISVQIYDASLGPQAEWRRIAEWVHAALKKLESAQTQLIALKGIMDRVRARAVYRSALDTIPLTESLAELPLDNSPGNSSLVEAATRLHILADDYWSVQSVLLK